MDLYLVHWPVRAGRPHGIRVGPTGPEPGGVPFDLQSGIRHEAWSPLTRGRSLERPVIGAIAKKHGRTNAQVVLRWDLQLGVVTIPKSVHRERILENSKVFDFRLDADDMARITGLDAGARIGPNPDTIAF